MSDIDGIDSIVCVAKLVGALMLENGGETSRAETAVYKICSAYDIDNVDVFAIPTLSLIHI